MGFAIMPLFALAKSGVAVSLSGVAHPIAAAVAVGIVLVSWLVVRLGLAKLPHATSWPALLDTTGRNMALLRPWAFDTN